MIYIVRKFHLRGGYGTDGFYVRLMVTVNFEAARACADANGGDSGKVSIEVYEDGGNDPTKVIW